MTRSALFDFAPAGSAPEHAVLQGAQAGVTFTRRRRRARFLEQLLLGLESRFAAGSWECRRHVDASRLGLVSHAPHLFGRMSVADNLALADDGRPDFAARSRRCVQETGLLAGVDPRQPAATLGWAQQVELNFVQAYLREPECLVFDHVFDHDDSAALLRLPALFRTRFPFRAVCHLEQAGRLPASLGISMDTTIDIP